MNSINRTIKERIPTLVIGFVLIATNTLLGCTLKKESRSPDSVQAQKETELKLNFIGFEVDETLTKKQAEQAKRGLQILYDGKAFRNGIPQSVFKLLSKLTPPKNQLDAFRHYGSLPSPPTRPDNPSGKAIPLEESFVERDGSLLATINCFMCHAGANAGMAVAGMANTHLDQFYHYSNYKKIATGEQLLKAISEARILMGKDAENDRAELQNMFHQLDEFLIPTFQYASARGDNMGPFAVWTYVARMEDPSNQGITLLPRGESSMFTELIREERLPTVDPNPWWHRKYKSSSYRYGENSEFRSAHFALNFTNPHPQANETHREHVEQIDTVLKFADQTRSPEYPLAIDGQLEKRGEALYHGEEPLSNGKFLKCHNCHGTYQKIENYGTVGNWMVDYREPGIKNVGTDSKYVEFLRRMEPLAKRTEELRNYIGFSEEEKIIPIAEVPPRNGYVPPPLVGAWITAPYFHNGSVPTLEQVLNTRIRPKVWRRSLSPIEYDYIGVGLRYKELDLTLEAYEKDLQTVGKTTGIEGVQYRAIYHTEAFGRNNNGHNFGDAMNTEERAAVIEFIKSLSGPNMVPNDAQKSTVKVDSTPANKSDIR